MTDEELFRQYRKGNALAFEDLYGRYRQSLYLYLLRSVPSQAEAEELYQETWSRVIHAKERFTEGSFRAWLFHIARNLRIDSFRRQRLQLVSDPPGEELPNPGRSSEEQADAEDCGDRLKLELQRLPEEQREVFLLKEESGLTLEQIGDMLGLGRETIKSRMRYALKRLRQMLEDCV